MENTADSASQAWILLSRPQQINPIVSDTQIDIWLTRYLFRWSAHIQVVLKLCCKMTSPTISASGGTLASHETLPWHKGTLPEHQSTCNENISSTHGQQGIQNEDQDTGHGYQATSTTQGTPYGHQGTLGVYQRTDREMMEDWRAFVIQEPLSDNMKALVRADLKKAWYSARGDQFRENLKTRWTTTDSYRMVLNDAFGEVKPGKLKYLCNKPTAFYWLESAQKTDCFGQRTLISEITLAAIYKEWTRSHRIELNIEFGHFFANPVRITPTGPSTIHAVLEAHRSLCAQASLLIDQAGGRADNIIEHNPSTSQHYALSPLYHAIVVIMDRQSHVLEEPDGFISLRKVAQDQTVLIARTGLEQGLSAPISFESLRSRSFPLERPDATMRGLDVIRVSLASAVHFIVNLEMRENHADPNSRDESTLEKGLDRCHTPQGFDSRVCHSPETWVDAVIATAEEHGYGNIFYTQTSIRRIEASKVGEEYCPLDYDPFRDYWRY